MQLVYPQAVGCNYSARQPSAALPEWRFPYLRRPHPSPPLPAVVLLPLHACAWHVPQSLLHHHAKNSYAPAGTDGMHWMRAAQHATSPRRRDQLPAGCPPRMHIATLPLL